MITLTNVSRTFRSPAGILMPVLRHISLCIPANAKIGLIGPNGAGKSTLLNLIGGIDRPSAGTVRRDCRVFWPLGLTGGFQGSLTGLQNIRFIARIHGIKEAHLAEVIDAIRDFSELGEALTRPVKTYSSGMRARLAFATSLSFSFDTYLVDELTAVGDAAFRKKSQKAFADLASKAGLIMVSHDEASLKKFCDSAIWLQDGEARCFDSVDEALKRYRKGRP